ncbi:hypothetical protein DFP73DRAFT_559940, partial [Morchella snyderi]
TALISAPISRSSLTTGPCPESAARCSAAHPSLSTALISAPISRSSLTTGPCPESAA